MTIRTIDVGEEPNDETGDTLRDGGIIINENFAELDTRTAAAQAKADQGVTDAAAAQAKADQGVTDAAKAQDAAAAAKAVADAAVPGSALGVTVAQLVDGKVPVPQLPKFVEPVVGKGLSTNDYTTPEKTKLGTLTNLKDQGIGGPGIPVPDGDLNKALVYGNYAVKPTDANGKGTYGFLEVITFDSSSVLQRLTTTRGHPVGEASWFRSISGGVWTGWARYVFVGDYGLGGELSPDSSANAAAVTRFFRTFNDANSANLGLTAGIHLQRDPNRSAEISLNWLDESMQFRISNGMDARGKWQKLVKVGDYGVGATSLRACNDANVVEETGDLLIHPGTLNGPTPGIYGTIRTTFYERSSGNFTQLAMASNGAGMFYRGSVNGSVQPWMRINEESITNSNGTAVKFSDGTMICRCVRKDSGAANIAIAPSIFMSSGTSFIWPVPFVGEAPAVAHSSETSAISLGWSVMNVAPTLTGMSDIRLLATSTGATSKISVIAVGRWR
ncbi:pyocin knob domain-containing protein [Pseudomonas protegens]|uniref:pyocin knob domain-containing protein n=1 Tax=Pseudomonas protegens TaxID=380021 RepID=UPI00069E2EAB|nr:pyocin knob domain-containing protein [Pseudomonas protegens]